MDRRAYTYVHPYTYNTYTYTHTDSGAENHVQQHDCRLLHWVFSGVDVIAPPLQGWVNMHVGMYVIEKEREGIVSIMDGYIMVPRMR